MADFETNQEYYLPPRPVLPTYPPAEVRAGEISAPSWLEKYGNYFSPGGLLREGAYGLGLSETPSSYQKWRDAGNLTDVGTALWGFGPSIARGITGIGKNALAPAGIDHGIASVLSRYAPREATRTGEAIAGGADDYWNTAHALSRNEGTINAARPSNEVSNGVTRPWLRDGSMPRSNASNVNEPLQIEPKGMDDALDAMWGGLQKQMTPGTYEYAAAQQAAARKAAEFDRNVTRFERALEGDPRSRFTVIEGGKRASGGAVDQDDVEMVPSQVPQVSDVPDFYDIFHNKMNLPEGVSQRLNDKATRTDWIMRMALPAYGLVLRDRMYRNWNDAPPPKASGGAVDDPIQNALRIARSFIDKYG